MRCLSMFHSAALRSEEHTSELQSRPHLVCRLLLDPAPTPIYTLSLHAALPIFECRLRTHHRSAPEPRGLARHRIVALRIGHVGMKREPQRTARARRTAAGADALLVDVPLGGLEIGRAHV